MGTEVSVRKTRQTCWNCKGRGWVDTFDAHGQYLGKETCTVCGGEGGWPLIIRETQNE